MLLMIDQISNCGGWWVKFKMMKCPYMPFNSTTDFAVLPTIKLGKIGNYIKKGEIITFFIFLV